MPTGWRPNDVAEKFPVSIITDVYNYEKYEPSVPQGLKSWSWAQLIINNLLLYFMLTQIASLSAGQVILFSTFLALSIFAYTSLMDNHIISLGVEILKFGIGLFILFRMSWFDLGNFLPFGSQIIFLYLIMSLALTVLFLSARKNLETSPSSVIVNP